MPEDYGHIKTLFDAIRCLATGEGEMIAFDDSWAIGEGGEPGFNEEERAVFAKLAWLARNAEPNVRKVIDAVLEVAYMLVVERTPGR